MNSLRYISVINAFCSFLWVHWTTRELRREFQLRLYYKLGDTYCKEDLLQKRQYRPVKFGSICRNRNNEQLMSHALKLVAYPECWQKIKQTKNTPITEPVTLSYTLDWRVQSIQECWGLLRTITKPYHKQDTYYCTCFTVVLVWMYFVNVVDKQIHYCT